MLTVCGVLLYKIPAFCEVLAGNKLSSRFDFITPDHFGAFPAPWLAKAHEARCRIFRQSIPVDEIPDKIKSQIV